MKNTYLVRAAGLLLALGAVSAASLVATAHEGRETGEFRFTVGFLSEPVYEGEPNGASVWILKSGAAEHGHATLFEKVVGPGEAFSFTFDHELEGKTIAVHFHEQGRSEVSSSVAVEHDGVSGTAAVEMKDGEFAPSMLKVQAGTTVTWTNKGQNPVVLNSGDPPGDEAAGGTPVTGMAQMITLDITHVPTGVNKSFEVQEVPSEPGHYVVGFIPTSPGAYLFRVRGQIGGAQIDESFTSGPATFDDVRPAREVQFPLQLGSGRELEGAVRGVQATAQSADDSASTARLLGIVGVVVGATGLAVGALSLSMQVRKRRDAAK